MTQKNSSIDRAKCLLNDLLHGPPIPVSIVEENAQMQGISRRTMQRARKELGLVCIRQGFAAGGQWLLRLPGQAQARFPITTSKQVVPTASAPMHQRVALSRQRGRASLADFIKGRQEAERRRDAL